MGVQTAIVETLTAEVRVLMVGSRQVTLSIARQADCVPLEDLEIIGRVRLDRDHSHVIGRSKSGVLAVAKYHALGRRWSIPRPDGPEQLVTYCPSYGPPPDLLTAHGRRFQMRFEDYAPCGKPHHSQVWRDCPEGVNNEGVCPHGINVRGSKEDQLALLTCEPRLTYVEWSERLFIAAIADADAEDDLHEAAAAAPLIFLAGLR